MVRAEASLEAEGAEGGEEREGAEGAHNVDVSGAGEHQVDSGKMGTAAEAEHKGGEVVLVPHLLLSLLLEVNGDGAQRREGRCGGSRRTEQSAQIAEAVGRIGDGVDGGGDK